MTEKDDFVKWEKYEKLVHRLIHSIDWRDYDNVDDVDNAKLARKIFKIYPNDYTRDLVKVTDEFMSTKYNEHDKQGKLLLRIMRDIG